MAKTLGFGSVITVASTTGEIDIGQVADAGGPDGSATNVDTTTLDTTGNFRTYARAPVDGGSLNLSVVYDNGLASHNVIGTLYASGTQKTWKVYPGSSTGTAESFTGHVESMGRAITVDDVIRGTFGIKVSGDPGFATT